MTRTSMQSRVLAISVSLAAAGNVVAESFDHDASTGAIVLPGVVDRMRTDPADRVWAPMPDRTVRQFQPPWIVAGVERAAQQVAIMLAEAKRQGKQVSVVLLPVDTPVRWTWTSNPELVRIGSDQRSAPIRAVLGTADLRTINSSPTMAATASVVVRAMVAQAISNAVTGPVRGAFGHVPVLVVERSPESRSCGGADCLLREALSPNSSLIVTGGATSGLREAAATSVARYRSKYLSAVSGPASRETSGSIASFAGDLPTVGRDGMSPKAFWRRSGASWSASLSDGTLLAPSWIPGTASPQADAAERLRPSVQVTPASGGLRIVFSYSNRTNRTCELASMKLPSFRLGASIRMQDTRDLGGTIPMSPGAPEWRGTYPGILYAPACVMRNDSVAVGISVEYPVLQYRHDIRLRCTSTSGGEWTTELGLENSTAHCGYSFLRTCPTLKPGESRTYCVNVVIGSSIEWLETLAPYRTFFQATYGKVSYLRDGRPVAGIALSQLESISAENPRGWIPGHRVAGAGRVRFSGFRARGAIQELL